MSGIILLGPKKMYIPARLLNKWLLYLQIDPEGNGLFEEFSWTRKELEKVFFQDISPRGTFGLNSKELYHELLGLAGVHKYQVQAKKHTHLRFYPHSLHQFLSDLLAYRSIYPYFIFPSLILHSGCGSFPGSNYLCFCIFSHYFVHSLGKLWWISSEFKLEVPLGSISSQKDVFFQGFFGSWKIHKTPFFLWSYFLVQKLVCALVLLRYFLKYSYPIEVSCMPTSGASVVLVGCHLGDVFGAQSG